MSLGVYVHVPFCERICPYCDFAVVAARPLEVRDEQRYVRALLRELELRGAALARAELESIYLGGGTPALLGVESVAAIVAALREGAASLAPDLEVTLEVNPSTLERSRLAGFRRAGVGRLSVGVQSFDDEVLRRLGRAHRADEARATLEAVRDASFDNLSLDLIFGAPGASPQQLERDLAESLRFAPEHVSAYELTVESGTPFALAEARGQLARPDEEARVDALERIVAVLGGAGIARYELSNFARPGFASRHNRRYWRRQPVLGLGVGAWSSFGPLADAPQGGREANTRRLASYLEAIEAGRTALELRECDDPASARAEALFLGLRELRGVRAAAFEAEFGAPPRAWYADEIDELVAAGLLLESPVGDLRSSERGLLFADSVAGSFVGTSGSSQEA